MGGKAPSSTRLGGCFESHDSEYACVVRSQPALLELFLGIPRKTRLHGGWLAWPVDSGVSRSGCCGGGHRQKVCSVRRTDRWCFGSGQVRVGATVKPKRRRVAREY